MEFLVAIGTAIGVPGTASATAATATTAATSATFAGMTGTTLLAATAAGTSALTSIRSGQAVREEGKFQSKLAGIAATGQEVERRRRLVRSLAQQSAAIGASGIGFEGSPTISLQDTIRQSDLDSLAISANRANQQSLLRMRGRSAVNTGRANAGATILGALTDISDRGRA